MANIHRIGDYENQNPRSSNQGFGAGNSNPLLGGKVLLTST